MDFHSDTSPRMISGTVEFNRGLDFFEQTEEVGFQLLPDLLFFVKQDVGSEKYDYPNL